MNDGKLKYYINYHGDKGISYKIRTIKYTIILTIAPDLAKLRYLLKFRTILTRYLMICLRASSMKKTMTFVASSIFLLTSCATTQGGAGAGSASFTVGQTLNTTISSANYRTFSFNSGAVPPRTLQISSYLPYGGVGAQFSGYPVVYPSVIIKDASGRVASARLISQTAVPPSMFNSLHLESKWQVQLQPGKNYLLQVKANASGSLARTSYSHTIAVGTVPVFMPVDAQLKAASAGNVEIKLN